MSGASWGLTFRRVVLPLLKHAIEGYQGKDGKLMPAKGGNPALTDAQIKATVDWMLSQLK